MKNISKAILVGASSVLLMSGVTGCTEALKRDVYKSCRLDARDPYWLEKFNLQVCDGLKTKARLACSGWFVSLEQEKIARKPSYDGGLAALQRDHMNFDPTADEIGRHYVDAAKARGSVVKMYRPEINKKLIKIVSTSKSGALGFNAGYSKFSDWDYALIEYSQNGQMLSALARQQQVYVNASPYLQDMFSVIVYDAGIRMLEQNVDNFELANQLVREI